MTRAEVRVNIPHTRGGEPYARLGKIKARQNIPHTRGGEPVGGLWYVKVEDIFPTRVGVNRPKDRRRRHQEHIPHTLGGGNLLASTFRDSET